MSLNIVTVLLSNCPLLKKKEPIVAPTVEGPIVAPGGAYVALSRCRKLGGIRSNARGPHPPRPFPHAWLVGVEVTWWWWVERVGSS